jgi:hypothetical protein
MPNDGSQLFHRHRTDRKILKRIPYTRIAVRCPYCGLEHTWGPQHAPLGQSVLLGKQIAPLMP